MKKTLLFAALLIGGLSQLNAQCTIVASCSTGTVGYCTSPAENTNLPNATELSNYNTTIQVSMGSMIGGIVPITGATITAVTGMPAGLSYSTNPTNGIMAPSSDACVLVAGTPASGSAGSYTITATVTVGTGFGPQTGTVSWFLTVDPIALGIRAYSVAPNFVVSPNPATSELTLSADFHFGKVQVIDALGKTVLSGDANYATQTKLDISSLGKGVYFLQANDGNRIITRKFIKD